MRLPRRKKRHAWKEQEESVYWDFSLWRVRCEACGLESSYAADSVIGKIFPRAWNASCPGSREPVPADLPVAEVVPHRENPGEDEGGVP